nr:ZIP family metal transporter [Propionibacterium sp.]
MRAAGTRPRDMANLQGVRCLVRSCHRTAVATPATLGPPRAPDPNALKRLGVLTAVVIALHNFPEGFATFMAAIQAPALAVPVAVAIGIHNIPEGIAVAVPLYHATHDRTKALGLAALTGLSEPVGGLLGFLVLRPFVSDALLGVVFGIIAGIMVFISLDELLPTAESYGRHHVAVYGVVAGMALMAISLVLL